MVVVAAVGSALAVIPVWLVGGLGVQISAELDLSEAEFGMVVGSFMAASAILSLAGGVVVRRLGWVQSLRWVALATAGACVGIAFTTGSRLWLVSFIGLAGASHALGQPTANVILVEEIPLERQGLAFGVKQSSIPIGTLLAGLAVPVIGSTIGWRWAFVAVSVACLGLLAVLRGATRREPRAARSSTRTGQPIRADLRQPLLVMALGGGLGTAASNSLGAFVVLYAVSRGIEPGTGGILVAAGSVANIIVRIVLGRLSDRQETDHLRWVGTMLLLGAGAFAVMAVASGTVFAAAVVTAFMTGWGWNGLYHLGVVNRYRAATATATGVVGLFLSTGAAVGPIVVGFVADRSSFTRAWFVVSALAAVAACLVLLGAWWHACRLERVCEPPPALD